MLVLVSLMCGCISSPELGTDDGSISEAEVGVFAFGLGKVYGLAFDEEGNLFATGTDGDKAVIWKINQDGEKVIFAEIKDQGDVLSDVGIACHSGHLANLAVDGFGNIWITSLQNGACFVVERDKEYSKIYLNSKLVLHGIVTQINYILLLVDLNRSFHQQAHII
jgi:sugar lactone lactonase YvrE